MTARLLTLILGLGLCAGHLTAAGYPLVSDGALWRYLDDGSDLGVAWSSLDFDDSEWPHGAAELGYGDGDETTVVGFGPNENNKFVTTYFRHEFEVSDPGSITNLSLHVLRDDGAVIYLNGQEVYRGNMPAGPILYRTLASTAVGSNDEITFDIASVPTPRLLPGRNVLAAEIHQSSVDSSDLTFDLMLVATGTNSPPFVSIADPPNNTFIPQPRDILLRSKATDSDGSVLRVSYYDGNVLLGEATESPFALLWTNAWSGVHTLVAVATDNNGLSHKSAETKVLIGNALADATSLVPTGAPWRYWDKGTDLGAAWRDPMFNDEGWSLGEGEFGYGDGDETTELGFGPSPANKYITSYFRHPFFVDDLDAVSRLQLRLLRDDGAIVYLNGEEILRSNMPLGPVDALTLAASSVDDPEETFFFTANVSHQSLRSGANVLAVEVHQFSPSSSDLSFNLELQSVAATIPVRGPWLQQGTPTSLVIKWRTDLPTDSSVRYGLAPDALDQWYQDDTLLWDHEVRLTSLAPDTLYYYSIGTSSGPIAGGSDCFFRTAPPVGQSRPVRVWALGDSGTASVKAENVRNAYYRFAGDTYTDVWLMLGDNAYQRGTDTEYQQAVFDMYPVQLQRSVLWSTIGNHDSDHLTNPSLEIPYFKIFTHPTRGEAGGFPSGTEKYYSFDYADIHFVCLDAMTSRRDPLSPMLDWLRSDLAATASRWLIAFWHHAPYTRGNHDSDVELEHVEMRQHVLPILEAHGVDLVLSGHTHSYERSMLIQGHYGTSDSLTENMVMAGQSGRPGESGAYTKLPNDTAPGAGAVYIVAGSSGKTSGGPLNHPAMWISLNRLGSVVLDIHGPRLDMKFLREDGSIDDSFTILKEPGATISDAVVTEQSDQPLRASFVVQLPEPRFDPVAIDFRTEAISALPNLDFVPRSGKLLFPPGETQQLLEIDILDDAMIESNETFQVHLTAPSGLLLVKENGLATLLDNEPRPTMTITSSDVLEGHQGLSQAVALLTVSQPSEQVIKVECATASVSAKNPEDYAATNVTVTFPPGVTEQRVSVLIKGDPHPEPDEALSFLLLDPRNVLLERTNSLLHILNDDGPPPILVANDTAFLEGTGPFIRRTFAIQLSGPSALPVTFNVDSVSGSAVEDVDFSPRHGTAQITPGATNYLLTLFFSGDSLAEPDETFTLRFSNPSNALLARDQCEVIILNDDQAPPDIQSIVVEGDLVRIEWPAAPGASYRLQFAVTLREPSWSDVPGSAVTNDGIASQLDTVAGVAQRFYRVVRVAP